MSEEIINLMHSLLEYHDLYENDYESFKSRYDFELFYWFHFKKLTYLIDLHIRTVKPFTNK